MNRSDKEGDIDTSGCIGNVKELPQTQVVHDGTLIPIITLSLEYLSWVACPLENSIASCR